jgi:hypothetical protein
MFPISIFTIIPLELLARIALEAAPSASGPTALDVPSHPVVPPRVVELVEQRKSEWRRRRATPMGLSMLTHSAAALHRAGAPGTFLFTGSSAWCEDVKMAKARPGGATRSLVRRVVTELRRMAQGRHKG